MASCSVCSHPDRAAIDKALVSGTSIRDIAGQFTLSRSAVSRHKTKCLAAQIARAEQVVRSRAPKPVPVEVERQAVEIVEQKDDDALDVMVELRRLFVRMNKMIDACDDWLTDPDDPTRYNLGPRAHEVMVTYEEEIGTEDRPRTKRRKAPLSQLLEEARGKRDLAYTLVETKSADPRDLIIKTANRLQSQTELLGRVIGELQDNTTINVVLTPSWTALRGVLLTALAEHPEARLAVAQGLREIGAGHGA